jgi:Trk K+ transport system NAD-binding subunit
MKILSALLGYFLEGQSSRRNLLLFFKFLLVLAALVIFYSIAFHFLMAIEGRAYSWITGLYWTLTVMTTLGFGDITFHSDLGRFFSLCVLMTGVIFLLTLLPFIFIKFFYAPWMEAESKNRAPKELPGKTRDHVILTNYDPITVALIEKLKTYGREYVFIVEDLRHALELYDMGIRVALGFIDDPETYRKMQIDSAALVVATNRDEINTNVAFTVRELNEQVPIITTADSSYSVDILQMAGSTHVLQLHDILGRSLAAWTVGGTCRSNVISQFDELFLAAFPALGTPLVGKTLVESRLRENFGITVAGIWEQGQFRVPSTEARISQNTVLLLAGTKEKLGDFDEVYSYYHICQLTTNPVLIIGGGRVGQTIADQFKEREMSYLIIEKNPRRMQEDEKNYVVGNAADIGTLQRAWVKEAPAALITTHDDATNIYLTKYLRSLRQDMQILSRASVERNVSTLHRAGADFVMSYSSLGANAVFSFLKNENTLILGEGLNVFRVPAPQVLVGKNLAQSKVREQTQCSIVAIKTDDVTAINPDPQVPIREDSELILIGTHEGEKKFLQLIKEK